MTFEDAATAVVAWLHGQPVKIEPQVFGREIETDHFRIGVVQVEPAPKKRVFDIYPLEVPYCYEVKEVEAA